MKIVTAVLIGMLFSFISCSKPQKTKKASGPTFKVETIDPTMKIQPYSIDFVFQDKSIKKTVVVNIEQGRIVWAGKFYCPNPEEIDLRFSEVCVGTLIVTTNFLPNGRVLDWSYKIVLPNKGDFFDHIPKDIPAFVNQLLQERSLRILASR